MTCGIYFYESCLRKEGYVGLSKQIEVRIDKHQKRLRKGKHNKFFQPAWDLHGEENFEWKILEECPEYKLKEREVFWEQKLKSEGWKLYNDAPCGKIPPNRTGVKLSPEHKQKIKILTTGENNPNFGKKTSKEVREKMRNSHLGIPLSPGHIEKISGEKHPKAKLTWEQVREIRKLYQTGEYFQRELGEMFGVSSPAIQGIVGNRTWREKND